MLNRLRNFLAKLRSFLATHRQVPARVSALEGELRALRLAHQEFNRELQILDSKLSLSRERH